MPQPLLLDVAPHHRFGLVPRQPPGEFDGDPEKRYKFLKKSLMTIHEENTVDEEDVKDGIGGQLSRNDEDCLFLGVSLNGDPDVLVEPESLIPPDLRTPSPRKSSAPYCVMEESQMKRQKNKNDQPLDKDMMRQVNAVNSSKIKEGCEASMAISREISNYAEYTYTLDITPFTPDSSPAFLKRSST